MYEGSLFLSVSTIQVRDHIMICRDRYTVRDGVVCEIKGGRVTPTGDTLDSVASAWRIGVFDPNAIYVDFPTVMIPVDKFVYATCSE